MFQYGCFLPKHFYQPAKIVNILYMGARAEKLILSCGKGCKTSVLHSHFFTFLFRIFISAS